MNDQDLLQDIATTSAVQAPVVVLEDEPAAMDVPKWTYDTWFSEWYRRPVRTTNAG